MMLLRPLEVIAVIVWIFSLAVTLKYTKGNNIDICELPRNIGYSIVLIVGFLVGYIWAILG